MGVLFCRFSSRFPLWRAERPLTMYVRGLPCLPLPVYRLFVLSELNLAGVGIDAERPFNAIALELEEVGAILTFNLSNFGVG
jgi:hypothetical protein